MAARHIGATLVCTLALSLAGAAIARAEGLQTQSALDAMPDSQADPTNTPSAPGISGSAPDSGYRLGPGDQVRIIVFGQPDLSGVFRLDGDGLISMPLINNIDAKGLSAEELQKRIVAKLTPNYLKNANASVDILSYRPFYIVGEVSRPGSYAYVNGMTAINAVALAGGFTYRADEDDFEIKRNVNGTTDVVDAGPETPIQPGDVITVDERWF